MNYQNAFKMGLIAISITTTQKALYSLSLNTKKTIEHKFFTMPDFVNKNLNILALAMPK